MQRPSILALLVLCCAVLPVMATDLTKNAADYSKEAFVLEQSSDRFKFENDGSCTREIRTRTRVQSDAGIEQFSGVRFAFQNSMKTAGHQHLPPGECFFNRCGAGGWFWAVKTRFPDHRR